MQYGIILTGGPLHEQVALAQAAEQAGWGGVFTWDGIHVGDDVAVYDPWVLMAAFAAATQRVRLGAIVMPLARRRPWKVARETVTLDHMSNGRLVLPVGLGTLDDSAWGRVGEPTERRVRAERLDETLEILCGLWSGAPFGYHGRHYRFGPMAFTPTPIQSPRIPIWVVGGWPSERSMSRVLRYDGLMPYVLPNSGLEYGPPALAAMRDWIAARRSLDGFDIVVEGTTPADDAAAAAETVRAWQAAGASWWIVVDWSSSDVDAVRRRLAAGPPKSPWSGHAT
jgi:alkanesulfonate monooxygenase SsuD/methylene tetrahydromethanopterin reductase-like flavin-dependent oxidoreductase (luciferase family)